MEAVCFMVSRHVKEFFEALKLISTEKGVDLQNLVEKLKSAIALAVRKQYFGVNKINVLIDVENLIFKVSFFKMVVANVKNFANEISLDDALKISKKAKLGETLEIEVDSKQIGRLAAGAAKQQIMQGIREIEKENIVHRMGGRVGTLVTAPVEIVESHSGNVVLKIEDGDVVLFKNSQLPGDDFKVGDLVKVYAVNLDASGKGSWLKVSRTHPDFVRKLFEVEVPEIEDGKIEIKNIAREAGVRTKIAVATNDGNLEPVGSCIGNKGTRIGKIIEELNGEKIDVIKFSENLSEFVGFALLPANILGVEIFEDPGVGRIAFVVVETSQISLAIGKRGLNVKLAALLTGVKIEIIPADGVNSVDFLIEQRKREKLEELHKEEVLSEQVLEVKTQEELIEEEDIHNFEVSQMIEQQQK